MTFTAGGLTWPTPAAPRPSTCRRRRDQGRERHAGPGVVRLTGSGTWGRVETYHYFATDPVAGYEHYTQASGLESSTGSLCNLVNGKVKVEVWNAIGTSATALSVGNGASVTLPYSGTTGTSTPPPSSSPTLYLQSNGAAQPTAGSAGTVSIPSAGGGSHDGTPTNALTFTATGLNLTPTGGTTGFDLPIDAGTGVGDGTQVRVSYDCTGSGTWNRVDTFHYFATDPVTGYEHYTQSAGLESGTGSYCALVNGKVKIEVWNAVGGTATTLAVGNQAMVTLPYH